MGLLDQILFGMGLLTVFFAFITLLYIKRNREFERLELESGLNALLFGMFFLMYKRVMNAKNTVINPMPNKI